MSKWLKTDKPIKECCVYGLNQRKNGVLAQEGYPWACYCGTVFVRKGDGFLVNPDPVRPVEQPPVDTFALVSLPP